MATRAELIQRVKDQRLAIKKEQLKRLIASGEIRNPRTAQQNASELLSSTAQPVDTSNVGALGSAAVGFSQGIKDVGRGIGAIGQPSNQERRFVDQLEEDRPISSTIGRISGQVAPFVLPSAAVGSIATIPARVLAATGLGAVEGGILTRGQGGSTEETAQGALLGSTIAGGLELLLPRVGRIGRKVFNRFIDDPKTILSADGLPTPAFQKALDDAGLSFDDVAEQSQRLLATDNIEDATQIARRTFLEEQGLVPTRAQVTQDVTDFQNQQELFKTSGAVREAIDGQGATIARRFDNAIVSTGGSANPSSSVVFDFIADQAIDQDAAITGAYKTARELAGDGQVVRLSGLTKALSDKAGSDRITGGLISSTKDILRAKGVLPNKGFKVQGRISPKVAEEVRIELNSLYDSLTPKGRSDLRDFKNAIDLDVQAAVGKDVFKDARKMKAEFERSLRRSKVNKFDKRNFDLVRDILDNKINPDRFLQDAVISNRVRSTDLEQLKRYLLDNDGGNQAWDSLRAEAMTNIRNNAVREVSGDPAMTRASIDSALNSIGKDKLRVLFSPTERKFLDNMQKVAKITEPKRATALGKGPSAQAVKELSDQLSRNPALNIIWGGVAEAISSRQAMRAITAPKQLTLKPSNLATVATPALIAPVATAQQEDDQ